MRKMLIILGLAAVTALATTNDVFAQRRGGGARGGWSGYRGGYSRPYYYGGYYRPYYRGYYWPYAFGGLYLGPYSYGGGYAYSSPEYYYPDVVTTAPGIRQSFYYAPSEQVASVRVLVPAPDAQVWFDNSTTTQQGMERMFHSPPLQFGTYTYTVRARWMENGQIRDQQREIQVQPGQTATVDFRGSASEGGPTPAQKK